MKKITLLFASIVLSFGLLMADALPAGDYYVPNDPGNGKTFYTSLTDAFTAINDNGIAGDITLYINDDILQTTNVGLINTSDYTITIRPDADVDRTITFSHAADDNSGPSGSLIIGIKMSLAWADITPSKNIIFDGYAEGETTRRLKIATSKTHHQGNPPILILNGSSDIQIKNMIILQEAATSGTSGYGIYLRCNTTYAPKTMPSNILIENNHITATVNTASQGIGLYANAAPTTNALGVKIKNNIINARTRGVFLSYATDIEITGNEFSINQTAGGVLSSVVMGLSGISGNVTFDSNIIKQMKTSNTTDGAYGIRGIIASGGGDWYITNNTFTGFDKNTATAGTTMLQAIRCGSPCYIYHNTFYLNALTNKPTYVEIPTDALGSYCAINIAAGTQDIKNNIFISDEDACTNFLIRGTVPESINNNIYYLKAGNTKARINLNYQTAYDSFAAYLLGNPNKDKDSKYVAVNFTDAAAGDLTITGDSKQDGNLAVPRLAGVLYDMFGTERAEQTYAGAHESDLPFIFVGFDQNQQEVIKVKKTFAGIEVDLATMSDIELYNINGVLIEKVRMDGTYSRDLTNGIYIIRINGQTVKFVK